MPFLSRKERKRKQKQQRGKKLFFITALAATASVATFVNVGATSMFPTAAVVAESSAENIEVSDNVADTVETAPVAMESKRIDKQRIWLNPAQEIEGKEAPIFLALCVHEVRDDRPNDNLAISTTNFHRIVKDLKEQGYWFLDSNDIVAIKQGKMQQPDKAVFLSFDDGYEDNYTNAYPILRQEGVKATFFLVAGDIGKDNRMTVAQLKEMAAHGMCFGSHTMNHKELDKLDDQQITNEMNDSKYILQHDYGIKIDSIAYPGGFQSQAVLDAAKANYEIAFIANMDSNTPDTVYTIHRYGVFRWNTSLNSVLKD